MSQHGSQANVAHLDKVFWMVCFGWWVWMDGEFWMVFCDSTPTRPRWYWPLSESATGRCYEFYSLFYIHI